MEEKAGAQISLRAFTQSVVILFILMMVAGILTRAVPAGQYQRVQIDEREMIDPDSFQTIQRPNYPVWRWFVAPLEVLGGPDGLTIIIIAVFVLMVAVSFAVLDKSGLLNAVIARIVKTFEGRKYVLLMVIAGFFMLMGAFFGIFEEAVPLVPLILALSYFLGWDALVGLGMSALAVNMGFSAAITNPFTIGIAQKLAGLPLFSGALLRVIIFAVTYAVLVIFLTRYARKIEKDPRQSPVYAEDQAARAKYGALPIEALIAASAGFRGAMIWFGIFLILILLALLAAPFVEVIGLLAMPIVGILFFIGGVGASLISGASRSKVFKAAWDGVTGIAPAVPLILMAASVKYIVAQGGILDTILHGAAGLFQDVGPFPAVLLIYILALVIELFVASGSAKAFLLMPILLPLADLVEVTRQSVVTAYCFGDGFTNMIYPTNPVLLICLGLTVVSYPKWLKWSLKLWGMVLLVTVIFLGIAVAIHYGPF
jgi:uncharacterized ion transporter superfamily protein YfcC